MLIERAVTDLLIEDHAAELRLDAAHIAPHAFLRWCALPEGLYATVMEARGSLICELAEARGEWADPAGTLSDTLRRLRLMAGRESALAFLRQEDARAADLAVSQETDVSMRPGLATLLRDIERYSYRGYVPPEERTLEETLKTYRDRLGKDTALAFGCWCRDHAEPRMRAGYARFLHWSWGLPIPGDTTAWPTGATPDDRIRALCLAFGVDRLEAIAEPFEAWLYGM